MNENGGKCFVHKALKDEQIECIHRIVCHGRDVLAVLPTGLGKSATYQLISKGPYSEGSLESADRMTADGGWRMAYGG